MGTEEVSLPRALWVLARPRLMPFVLLLPVVGFGWGHWDRALELRGAAGLPWVLAAWLLLQAGTMWLNAALDRDRGEVLWGRAVAVPRATATCAYAALLLAVALAFVGGVVVSFEAAERIQVRCDLSPALVSVVPGCACAICGILSVLYSHPATVWKGHAILGPVVNGLGYGLLSTLAGWGLVGVGPNPRTVAVWLCGGLGVLGCYFAVQAFQADEDRARGYRTLVATHGPRATLLAARLCIGLGELGGVVLAVSGWLPRLSLLALAFAVWVDRWLAAWARQPGGGDESWARGLAKRLLIAALLGIGLAYVDYFIDILRERHVNGLGTARGWPNDVEIDPPWRR